MRMMFFPMLLGIIPLLLVGDTAQFVALIVDDGTGNPIQGVTVRANFAEEIGVRAWTEAPRPDVSIQASDRNGLCRFRGKTNSGRVCCWVPEPPAGYYAGTGWGHRYETRNLFGVWQPDNLVATIRLQRVEHPIPLTVKRVEWRDWRRGLRGLQGTNAVMRFDMLKGDWLPPYGSGETADLTVRSQIVVTGSGRLRKLYPDFGWTSMDFYEVRNEIVLPDLDAISEVPTNPRDGMKIREAFPNPCGKAVSRVFGRRQVFGRNGRDWQTKHISDYDRDRCYVFRIRSRRDEKGNLVEAYYGKIYGDFEFSGDLERGVTDVCFLYYLNPTPLDRNLEWDRKNNLCPTPGNLIKRLP